MLRLLSGRRGTGEAYADPRLRQSRFTRAAPGLANGDAQPVGHGHREGQYPFRTAAVLAIEGCSRRSQPSYLKRNENRIIASTTKHVDKNR